MGIYWVYFRYKNNQLKLQVEAETKELAEKIAVEKAKRCNLECWELEDIQVCR